MVSIAQGNALGAANTISLLHALKGQKSIAQGNALWSIAQDNTLWTIAQDNTLWTIAQGNTLWFKGDTLWFHVITLGICICRSIIALWLLICEHISFIKFNIIQFQKLPVFIFK